MGDVTGYEVGCLVGLAVGEEVLGVDIVNRGAQDKESGFLGELRG